MSTLDIAPIVVRIESVDASQDGLEQACAAQWGSRDPMCDAVKVWVTVTIARPPGARRRYPRGEPRPRTVYARVERALVWAGVISSIDDVVDERCVKVWGVRDLVAIDITRP